MEALSEKEWAVLAHLYRYKISTEEVLERACDLDKASLSKTLSGLRQRDFLEAEACLLSQKPYLELKPSIARALFETEAGGEGKERRLSREALYRAYAFLCFCCLAPAPYARRRILKSEFREAFPGLSQAGLPDGDYYLSFSEEGPPLGMLLVDTGRLPIRICRHAHELLQRRAEGKLFRKLLRLEEFELSVMTYSEHKAEALAKAFQSRALQAPLSITVWEELALFFRRKQGDIAL